jgi:CDP-diacylglycerol--glycerol-3-phosphate 3-phosphatidyltransferase
MYRTINFPTLLTLIRLIISPLVLPILFVYFLPLNILLINCILAAVFVLMSLTDFFDGYLARKYDQVTAIGKLLDPIADKFFIFSSLVALLTINKIFFFWVIILIGREFFVMGLRLIALEHQLSVPVSALGKLKTVLQVAYLTFVIINPYQHLGFAKAATWNAVEGLLLGVTLIASLWSAYLYFKRFMTAFRKVGNGNAK